MPPTTAPRLPALEQLKQLAWLLDSAIRLPGGFRIGLDALIGLVPWIGDAAGVALSAYIVCRAAALGAPASLLTRMTLNVAIEGIVGLVPLAGDLFDAGWKANQRNVALLEQHLADPAAVRHGSRLFVGLTLLGVLAFLAALIWLTTRIVAGVFGLFAGG